MEAEGAAIAERDTGPGRDAESMRPDVSVMAKGPGGQVAEPVRLVAHGPSSDEAAAIKRVYRMADLSSMEPSLQEELAPKEVVAAARAIRTDDLVPSL